MTYTLQVADLKQVHRSLSEEEERERQIQHEAKCGRWSQAAQLQATARAQKIQAKKHHELVSKLYHRLAFLCVHTLVHTCTWVKLPPHMYIHVH